MKRFMYVIGLEPTVLARLSSRELPSDTIQAKNLRWCVCAVLYLQ
jgi:hypothetical protein